jgi:hypothetical protein
MKGVILVLLAFGLLLLISSRFFGITPLFIGLALIAGGIFLGFRPGGILRKESAIDTWAVLLDEACVEDGHHRTDNLYRDITANLKASEAPSLKVEAKLLAPSMTRGLFGDQRDFLVLTDDTNYRLRPYQIYISARPYGVNLAAEWFLTYRPKPWMALLSLIPYVNLIPQSLSDIDLFDQQDLRAYAANAHHCMLQAVTELMESLNQDPSKLDKASKGFFGVA